MGQFFPDKDELQRGLYRKFNVSRTDGSTEPGGKHEDCRFFVLDIDHDPFAIPALRAYAEACGDKYPELANDLLEITDPFNEPTVNNEVV